MAETVGEVVESGDFQLPYKVVFSTGGRVLIERLVTSRLAGQELIERLLPTIQGYDPGPD